MICLLLGMCKPPEVPDGSVNSSSVEDLREPISALFSALTATEDANLGIWTVVRYPAYESLLHHRSFGVQIDEGMYTNALFSF